MKHPTNDIDDDGDSLDETKVAHKKTIDKENEGDSKHPKTEDVQDAGEDEDGSEGVTVPEEFQQQVHALVKDAEKPHLNHLRDRIGEREDEIRDKEMKAKSKEGSKGKGLNFSSADMPSPESNY